MCVIKDVKLLILDFFQKGLDEIFFNGWILIPACEDCTKLKRNLQLSKNRPGGSQDPQCIWCDISNFSEFHQNYESAGLILFGKSWIFAKFAA